MGGMTVGLVIAGVAVIGVVLLVLRWRFASGEQQALRHYQNALDTLRTVSDRMESSRPAVSATRQSDQADQRQDVEAAHRAAPTVDRTPPSRAPSSRAPSAARPSDTTPLVPAYRVSGSAVSAPVQEGRSRKGLARNGSNSGRQDATPEAGDRASLDNASPSDPLVEADHSVPSHHPVIVFEEDDTVVEPAGSHSGAPFASVRPTRSSRRALQRSSRPPSRLPAILGVLLVVVVIAVAVAVAVGAGSHPHSSSPPPTTTRTTTAVSKSHVDTTTNSTSPPTTAQRFLQPEAATVTAQGASYPAPTSSYSVTLTSTGACWVYAKLASTGAVVWTGTLQTGQAQTLDVTGQLVVELGHANTLAATLNGLPVQYPAQYQAVFTLNFVPSTL
jgi:hypothetical protein